MQRLADIRLPAWLVAGIVVGTLTITGIVISLLVYESGTLLLYANLSNV